MIPAIDDREYFRSTTIRAPATAVDQKGERILGAKVIQFGDLNDDRPITIDLESLAQVAELGNQPNKGVKARLTHPSMSDDGLGRYLGRWRNFRVEGDAVYADLHIASSAHDAPEGDIASYVLGLAEEDPEAFGVSIVFWPDTEAMDTIQAALPEGARVPLRILKLRAADFVDEPAATRGGLFSMNPEDPRSLAPIVAKILDEHFGDADPQDVLDRFARLLSRHYGRKVNVTDQLNEPIEDVAAAPPEAGTLCGLEVVEATPELEAACCECTTHAEAEAETEADDSVSVSVQLEAKDPDEYIAAFGDRGARWYLEGLTLEECYRARCAELEQLAADLEARLNAALEATGELEPVSAAIELSADEKNRVRRDAEIAEAQKKGIPEKVSRWSRAFQTRN